MHIDGWPFDFPDDLLVVWKIARAIDEKHPLDAFLDSIGVRLEGPFVVLAGGKLPKDRGRWASDPPELFTIASGDTDGLHWGYVVHDPGKTEPYCAHFHSRDGYPITPGTTLYAALRGWLEDVREEKRDELARTHEVGEPDRELEKNIAGIDRALAIFRKHKAPRTPKRPKTIAPTLDGLGIVCEPSKWAKWAKSKANDPVKALPLAKRMLEDGKPGGALAIARDAYASLAPKDQKPAREVLAAAYVALGRSGLAEALGVRDAELAAQIRAKKKRKNTRAGSWTEALEDLGSVRMLVISYPNKGEPLPKRSDWAKMPKLEELVLRGIKIDFPPAFAKLPLRSIELMECKPAKLPRVLLRMPKLEEIELHAMRDIPKNWKLPRIERFNVYESNLRELPTDVVRSKRLFNLAIGQCPIAHLPEAIGKLHKLSYLSITRTLLREFPDVLDAFPRLDSLWLDGNKLERMPGSLAARKNLQYLALGKNPLVKDKAERARIKKMVPKKTKIYWT